MSQMNFGLYFFNWPIEKYILGLNRIAYLVMFHANIVWSIWIGWDGVILQQTHNKQLDLTHGQFHAQTFARTNTFGNKII